ncbi:MAG TPA: amidohydrolase family protein, partial [Dehalococcoidia bacterium]|nr:amidohydrolase family protein [Dehalococcoidia bacterium]
MNGEELLTLMRVAQGREPADLVVRNGRILNVYTGEIHEGWALAAKGERIAYLGPQEAAPVGPATQVIDAEGQVAIPGLVESHTHLIARCSIEEFLRYAVPGGTTTIVTEVIEMGSVLGLKGIMAPIEAMSNQPIKIYFTAPPLVGLAPFMEKTRPSLEEYRRLLARPDVVGTGEAYWGSVVLREDREVLDLLAAAREAGKVVEGHSAGARNQKLIAYGAAGASSCHEPINAQEVMERLRLGIHVQMREGWIRQDLEAIAPIWGQIADTHRLSLATDAVEPSDLLRHGYLEKNLQKAIDLGLDPVKAVQMCTVNPAEHFRLDQDLGALAPGRYADLILLPDLKTIRARLVVSNGRVVAVDGRMVVEPRRPIYPPELYHTVMLPRPLSAQDFLVPAPSPSNRSAEVRAIEMVTDLVTQETQVELPIVEGYLSPQP